MKRVTGIGGVFFKAENPKRLRDWYARHLGLPMKPFGSVVRWREFNDPEREGYTIWSPFPRDTKYFGEKTTDFMINFRVEDLDAVLRALRRERVRVEERVEELEYGRFAWIRAGITFVSLTTTSPSRGSSPGKSEKRRWRVAPLARS